MRSFKASITKNRFFLLMRLYFKTNPFAGFSDFPGQKPHFWINGFNNASKER